MQLHFALLSIGALFLVGLVADVLGRRTHIPRVTLLMLVGVMIGPVGLDMLPPELEQWYEFLTSAALTMVAFLLGGALSVAKLKSHGREIVIVSIAVAAASVGVVGSGLWLFGVPISMALLLAGISAATDPAATLDVVRQSRAKGRLARLLTGIVAIDDAWGLLAFSLLLVAAKALNGDGGLQVLLGGLWEIGGAIAVGVGLGLPAAALTGRLRPGEPMQAEALAVVFLCAGLAIWLGVSFLLAGMICGMMVTNFARHHDRPFHEIENIEWPFMVLFFVLAGASLHADGLGELWVIFGLYLILRIAARLLGGWAGGSLAGLPPVERRWIGAALMPQAGVAVGMALVAGDHFPELRQQLLTITVATTIVFEVFGPILTQIALTRARSRSR
jgi:Kef-type K+ transport system membrane component KefB